MDQIDRGRPEVGEIYEGKVVKVMTFGRIRDTSYFGFARLVHRSARA